MPGRKSMRSQLLPGDGPLAKTPPIVVFIVVVGLFVAGVTIRGVPGAVLLGLLAAGVVVLLAATWKVLRPGERVLRVLVLLMLVGVIITVLR